jgi:hypothetical protein
MHTIRLPSTRRFCHVHGGEYADMDSNRCDALIKGIKERIAKYHDLTFAAGLGITDPDILESVRPAAESEAEYESLLAIYEGR